LGETIRCRNGLFADGPDIHFDPAAPKVVALRAIGNNLRTVGVTPASEVERNCIVLSEWAEAECHIGTALGFAIAAAASDPKNSSHAFRVGRLARRRADYMRAEAWYLRASVLAREEKEWEFRARSLLGLGNVCRQRGNLPLARKYHLRGLKAAREHSIPQVLGSAYQELCSTAIEMGRRDEVLVFGRRAYRMFGRSHPQLPVLASDLAWFWMVSEGAFHRALPIFRQVLRHVQEPVAKLFVIANIARTAGGAGDLGEFHVAWNDLWEVLAQIPSGEGHAAALLDSAHGALSLALPEYARSAAERARVIAHQREEHKIAFTAEAVLASIRSNDAAIQSSRSAAGTEDVAAAEADDLAHRLERALRIRTTRMKLEPS
jgi:tetratricopeptide (TPR) repeat protein